MLIPDWVWFIAEGSLITLKYSLLSVILGSALAIIIAILSNLPVNAANWFATAYISIIRGTPLLVQLSFFYIAIPILTGYVPSVFTTGIIGFSINSSAYLAVHINSGIKGVDHGQIEASHVLGIPYAQTMKDIVLPQAFKRVLPSLVNEVVNMIKESSIIAFFGEADLMKRSQLIAAEHYTYLAPLMVAGLCYYILVTIFSMIAYKIEAKMYAKDL
jgi:His/Glu/Gln/Arg/opine family amino acid ABC transporter permease subunit